MHHIISDGNLVVSLVNELSNNYNSLIKKQKPLINLTDKTFTEAVAKEQLLLTRDYLESAKNFWLDFISALPLNVGMPIKSGLSKEELDKKSGNKQGECIYFDLSPEYTHSLKEYAKEHKATLFIVLASLYGVILSKYSNQERILLSYPINMRPLGYTNVSGSFVNNIPLKIELDKISTIEELIQNLVMQRKSVRDFQGYSLTYIINDQKLYNKQDLDSYFNISFTQTSLNSIPLQLEGLITKAIDIGWSSNVINDFGLQYDSTGSDSIKFKLEYRKTLYDLSMIEGFIQSFLSIINSLIQSKGQELNIKTYCVLDKTNYEKVVYNWNNTFVEYQNDKTIHELFEEQVNKTPDNIALVFEDIKLTYNELNIRSNKLAHYLRSNYEIRGDDLIALCLNRSEYMIISIIATLKSGAAYVPIDPHYPKDRIKYILSDTKAKVILASVESKKILTEIINENNSNDYEEITNNLEIIGHADDGLMQKLSSYPDTNLPIHINSTNLAYVIYTSGTTGKPKGVMIEHRNLSNYLNYTNTYMHQYKRVCSYINYTFDGINIEIYPSLTTGKTLFVLDESTRLDLPKLYEFIKVNKIDYLMLTSLTRILHKL